MKNCLLFFICLLVLLFVPIISAQEESDSLIVGLHSKHFNIGGLLQVVGDFQYDRSFPGNNGFNIANFRLKLYGEITNNSGYFLQTNFVSSPAILDADLYFKFLPTMTLLAGYTKAPFSAEYLISAANIDFVNRSQVVTVLSPKRQIGIQIIGNTSDQVLNYKFAILNGNGLGNNNNDNNDFMYVGRMTLNLKLNTQNNSGNNKIVLGLNAATSKDNNLNINGLNFTGKRNLFGGDIRFTYSNFLLSGEAIYGKLEQKFGNTLNSFGYYATVGYSVSSQSQLLVRWDSFRFDNTIDFTNLVLLGYNLTLTKYTAIQVNYIIPVKRSFSNHQLLVNLQFNF